MGWFRRDSLLEMAKALDEFTAQAKALEGTVKGLAEIVERHEREIEGLKLARNPLGLDPVLWRRAMGVEK